MNSFSKLLLSSALITTAFMPLTAGANPAQTRNYCLQAAQSRGYRVLDISQPVQNNLNLTEATVRISNQGRNFSLKCFHNSTNGRLTLEDSFTYGSGGNTVGNPRLLGITYLSPINGDRDQLTVSGANSCNLSEIQIRSIDRNIDVEDFWVEFANGQRERFSVRERINAGQRTRWLDFKGNKRCLARISITGDASATNRSARVEFWGR